MFHLLATCTAVTLALLMTVIGPPRTSAALSTPQFLPIGGHYSNSTGVTTFSAAVSAASVTTNAGGSTAINGATITNLKRELQTRYSPEVACALAHAQLATGADQATVQVFVATTHRKVCLRIV